MESKAPEFVVGLVALLDQSTQDELSPAAKAAVVAELDRAAKADRFMSASVEHFFTLAGILIDNDRNDTAMAMLDVVKAHPAVLAEVSRGDQTLQEERLDKLRLTAKARLGEVAQGAAADPNAPTMSLKDLLRSQKVKP